MTTFTWLSLVLTSQSMAHTTAQDAIKSQQGCFEVTFQYEEVRAHQEDYQLASPKETSVVEWVNVEYEDDERIVLQHILVTPPMIKHWRQIWVYQGTSFDVYSGFNQWIKKELDADEVVGQWVQEVDGVADNPRYGCSAMWQLGQEAQWSCRTWAPKPRRDKDRDDYTVLDRINTHRIVADGWVHEQRNTKLLVTDESVTPVVTEVGLNTYRRIDESECFDATEWWAKRQLGWHEVQRAWDEITADYQRYELTPKRGVFPLWVRLFWIARRPMASRGLNRIYRRSTRVISRHIEPVHVVPDDL